MFKQLAAVSATSVPPQTFPSKGRTPDMVVPTKSTSSPPRLVETGKKADAFKDDGLTIKPGDLPDTTKKPALKTPQMPSENLFENTIRTIDTQLEKATKFIDKLQEEYFSKLRSAEDSKKVLCHVKDQLEEKLDQEKARGQKRERTK